MDSDAAARIEFTLTTPGWQDILAILLEQRDEAKDRVYHLMHSSPDKLTGKTALKYAARARSLEDFLESVEDYKKALPTRKGGGQE